MNLASVLRRENSPERNMKIEKLRFVSTECIRTCTTNRPISERSSSFNDSQLMNEREDS